MRKHLITTALTALISTATAEGYPIKPITFVVPFAAGGPLDSLARAIAEPMSADLGQPIIVENVAGAAGSIGVGRVVHAPSDGYVVGVGNWSTHVLNGAIYALSYDLLDDLAPVVLLPSAPQLIVAKISLPAASLRELVMWLQSNKATVGTAGMGSASHVSGLLFQSIARTEFAFVPYRSAGAALQDLVAGHIDLMFDQAVNSLPRLHAKAIKAFAVTGKSRLAAAPDVPTVDEAGVSGFYISVWNGLWVPKGTAPDVIARLNTAAVKAMAMPVLGRRFVDLGQDQPAPDQLSPPALGTLQKAEIAKWWPILKAARIGTN